MYFTAGTQRQLPSNRGHAHIRLLHFKDLQITSIAVQPGPKSIRPSKPKIKALLLKCSVHKLHQPSRQLVKLSAFPSDSSSTPGDNPAVKLVDAKATDETRALFHALRRMGASDRIMFGQEFATDMGRVQDLNATYDQSDIKDVVGSHPAVHGSDFHFFLYKSDSQRVIHEVAVRAAYERGAVVTFDWHMYGRYEATYQATPANANLVSEIVEDRAGSRAWYYGELYKVAAIVRDLGFPIIFRPLHEMTGNWFWWGAQVGTEPYKELWRLTVDYLKACGVHNLLYAWSTNRTPSFEFYPGDAYVDVLGTDGYEPGSVDYFTTQDMVRTLATLVRYAQEHGKIAAFTETGHRAGYPSGRPKFWTEDVLAPILADSEARHISWILTWINSSWSGPYVPYAGMNDAVAIEDFTAFYAHPATVFEDSLPPMYQIAPASS